MAHLEDFTRGTTVKGILPDGLVTVVDVKWIGTVAIEITYKDSAGELGNELLYRDHETGLEVAAVGRPWSFDGDGALFRLVSEARRIQLAHLFDPLLAVHTALVEPLPHQITAVYGEMLLRQPLRFLLADDPGAGKTIMTGMFIKELVARGDRWGHLPPISYILQPTPCRLSCDQPRTNHVPTPYQPRTNPVPKGGGRGVGRGAIWGLV